MTDKIEEVKKILKRLDPDNEYSDIVLTIDARDICRLFDELKSDPRTKKELDDLKSMKQASKIRG